MASVSTAVLDIAYEQWGPADGPPVVLVHGFTDDATSWAGVAEPLAAAGHRVLAPHLRGVGPTRFRDAATPRSGQLGALVDDLGCFLDATGVDRAVLVGQDWGARAVQGVAALHPERVEHLVSLGSYGLSWGDGLPPAPVLHALWYQWVLLLDLGPAVLHADREGFCSYLWDAWSPTWPDRQAAFRAVAPSLRNPDFVDVVLSAYRHGRAETATDPRYDELDAALDAGPTVDVPTTVLLGEDDGVEQPSPDDPRDAACFTDLRARRVLPGVGHFVHREAPDAVASCVAALRS